MQLISIVKASFALVLGSTVFVFGCAATGLNAGARSVIVSRQPAPQTCVYVGSVVGEQGGALEGPYTSNKNLAVGAMNDMKNNAHGMGANYVVLEDTQAGTTISGSKAGISGQQTDVTHMGNAYRCPQSSEATTTAAATTPEGR
jgi:uncharacterized protein YbjQ (UPF0145 family)